MEDEAAEALDRASESRDPGDVARPLSTHVMGSLEIHFDRGHVARRTMSQAESRSFLNKQRGVQQSDSIDWQSAEWCAWTEERVVYTAFATDHDQNWEITLGERDALEKAGHPRGVVQSLRTLWRDRSVEPMYSCRAVALLHELAVRGTDERTWNTAATTFEGRSGADLVAHLITPSKGSPGGGRAPGEPMGVTPDDASEPDDAAAEAVSPDAAETPSQDDGVS